MNRRFEKLTFAAVILVGCNSSSHIIGSTDNDNNAPIQCNTACFPGDDPCVIGYAECDTQTEEATCAHLTNTAAGTPCGTGLACDGEGECVTGGNTHQIDRNKLDILFIVDNSASMEEEQKTLAMNIPGLIRTLVTGDRLGNDSEDPSTRSDNFVPYGDLQVGVVTTDLGTADVSINTCQLQPNGEDALLRDRVGSAAPTDCQAPSSPVMSFVAGTDGNDVTSHATPADFAHEVACVAQVGMDGCGFEQQLEVALKAVTPASSPIRFFSERNGSGTGTRNEGLIRDDARVLVVLVTDEEDCSFQDISLIDGSRQDVRDTNINLRCALFPSLLYPVSRYVTGLRALRPGREDTVYFGAIVGVPTDLIGEPGQPTDFDAILSDPRMVLEEDRAEPGHIRPVCNDSDRGKADPARRIVRVARDFGDHGFIVSICQSDYSEIATRIARMVQ